MKFKRTWIESMKLLPVYLQEVCIDYKTWKKCKNIGKEEICRNLQRDIEIVNRVFVSNNCMKFSFCRRRIYTVNNAELYEYLKLNKVCIYKICKRLDKRYNLNMMGWYNNIRRKYEFLCGFIMKKLECEVYGCKEECPICFDTDKTMIISNCGHLMCTECIENMYNIKGKKGTLKNLISAYDAEKRSSCPICRSDRPFQDIDLEHVWPQDKNVVYNIKH